MTYDLRLTALNIARELPHTTAEELIAAASKIEAHLCGVAAPTTITEGTVTSNTLRDDTFDPAAPVSWSGTAEDLHILLTSGSTIICKARDIGMTSYLAEFVANKSKENLQILWLSANGRLADEARKLIAAKGGNTSVIDFGGLNRFDDTDENGVQNKAPPMRGLRYDLIVVDGLAFLPYGKETAFMSIIGPLSKHVIFASEPGQKRGLFYDLWTNSTSMQKVALMWNTPLYPARPDAMEHAAKLREALGDERFRNQFECAFREVTDE